MSSALSLVSSLVSKFSSFEELKENLTSKKYNLLVKESKNYPSLFLLSPGPETDFTSEIGNVLNNCIGVIMEKEQFNIVCISYDRVFSLEERFPIHENIETSEKIFQEEVESVSVFEEGTFIRAFYYQENWIFSSLRCIDTKETYVPGTKKNFTDMFLEAGKDIDMEKLDKNFTYTFILKHPENRCIIPHKTHPCLIYTGKFENKTGKMSEDTGYSSFLKEPQNEKLWVRTVSYNNKKTSLVSLLNVAQRKKLVLDKGFLLHMKDGTRVSIIYDEFSLIQSLRGTNPSIKIRYLELAPEQRCLLMKYFPDYNLHCIEEDIHKKVLSILKAYRDVNVHKSLKIQDTGRMHRIIYQLHSYYLKTRRQITYDAVYEKLWSLSPATIAWIMHWI